jgi:pimeloyl-ACP methyl ester carboxylesterase
MKQSQTRYARSGDVHIAYQIHGEGPLDLVFVAGFVSNVEAGEDEPGFDRMVRRLSSFSRLIIFDKRGTGLSDPVSGAPMLEERMDDVRAVMDAAGSRSAALVGVSEGGPMSALFAATYPDRVTALVMYGTYAKAVGDEEYPWMPDAEIQRGFADAIEHGWGQGQSLQFLAPSQADRAGVERWARLERRLASPGMAAAMLRLAGGIDVRDVLPTIQVPALIVHRTEDQLIGIGAGRDLADRIQGAKLVELPGGDHGFWSDPDQIADEIEEFLTGARHEHPTERVLSTVLFTDIVGSTARAAEMGDRGWRELLERHDSLVRRQLERFRGREVKATGDGFLATFDGPARAIRCATSAQEAVRPLDIEIRAGVHTGECELRGEDIGGIAVHIGARVVAGAGPGELLVSGTVKDLVAGSGIEFAERGTHELRGVPGEWRLFAVERCPIHA